MVLYVHTLLLHHIAKPLPVYLHFCSHHRLVAQAYVLAFKELCTDCRLQVCINCHELCHDPKAMTLHYCAGCARPVHGCCRTEEQIFSHPPEADARLQRMRFLSLVYHASSLVCPQHASHPSTLLLHVWPVDTAM